MAFTDLKIGDSTGLIAANLEGDHNEISALQGGLRSRWQLISPFAPTESISLRTTVCDSSSRVSSISISATCADFSAGRWKTSPRIFLTNTVEPAPIKVILGRSLRSLHLVIEPLQSGTPFSVALPCSHRSIPESSDRPLSATKSEFSGTDCAKGEKMGRFFR